MDTFKIICIIFMMIVIYQIYQINRIEGFEGSTQSLGGIDDTNAINTLAQIAKNLMTGGVTIPGDIHTSGIISSLGPTKKNKVCLHTPGDGRRALYISPQKIDGSDWEWGNGLALDFNAKSINTNSNSLTTPLVNLGGKFRLSGVGDANGNDDWLRLFGVDNKGYYGGLAAGKLFTADNTINGRNIFAELDDIKKNLALCLRRDRGYYMKTGTRKDGQNAWHNGNHVHTNSNGVLSIAECCPTAYTFYPQ